MNIAEFITARLDEDERAIAAVLRNAPAWTVDDDATGWEQGFTGVVNDKGRAVAAVVGGYAAAHIARHDPTRVLADIDAKRKLIMEAFYYAAKIDGEWGCGCSAQVIAAGHCHEERPEDQPVLRILATCWSNHPDYKPSWALT